MTHGLAQQLRGSATKFLKNLVKGRYLDIDQGRQAGFEILFDLSKRKVLEGLPKNAHRLASERWILRPELQGICGH